MILTPLPSKFKKVDMTYEQAQLSQRFSASSFARVPGLPDKPVNRDLQNPVIGSRDSFNALFSCEIEFSIGRVCLRQLSAFSR